MHLSPHGTLLDLLNINHTKMINNYFYFATHIEDQNIYKRLEVGAEYSKLPADEQALLKQLLNGYYQKPKETSALEYCANFANTHQTRLKRLQKEKGYSLKFFLKDYLAFSFKWGSSIQSYGQPKEHVEKADWYKEKRAQAISHEELVSELTDKKGSIYKLLSSAGNDKSLVKIFLPYIVASLNTDTRDKRKMSFEHTGKFVFDFDDFEDEKTTVYWMNKIWKGTTNIKPYMAFVSPSGKGLKLFCQVDISLEDFKNDFKDKHRESVMNYHKIWYKGALEELKENFPNIPCKIDEATIDPQRATFLPFISNKKKHFKENLSAISNYSEIVNQEKERRDKEVQKEIVKNKNTINKIKKEHGIKSDKDALHLYQKNNKKDFDLKFELEKFTKTVSYIVGLAKKDQTIKNWVASNFTCYNTLLKQSWVLYGVFGEIAINEIKKLIPNDSNKKNPSNGDYRWTERSQHDYDADQRANLTPAAFYKLVFQIGKIKDYVLKNFVGNSKMVKDLKQFHRSYEKYENNLDIEEKNNNNTDKSEFLSKIKASLDSDKKKLPLIEDQKDMKAEVTLGPDDYLDKKVMEDLFQKKYRNQKVFMLRSQCGE